MTTKANKPKPSRLMAEMRDTATEMHTLGIMDDASYAKITMRQIDKAEAATVATLTGEEIRALREQAKMSQAVFAKYLNMTVGHISKLERGAERPTGPALVLLNVIRKHGMEAIL